MNIVNSVEKLILLLFCIYWLLLECVMTIRLLILHTVIWWVMTRLLISMRTKSFRYLLLISWKNLFFVLLFVRCIVIWEYLNEYPISSCISRHKWKALILIRHFLSKFIYKIRLFSSDLVFLIYWKTLFTAPRSLMHPSRSNVCATGIYDFWGD